MLGVNSAAAYLADLKIMRDAERALGMKRVGVQGSGGVGGLGGVGWLGAVMGRWGSM